MDQIGPKMDKQGQKGLWEEIILNVVSLGRSPTVNFAPILQKSHYSIPLVCTHKNLNISMLQKRPIFNSCCVHTQTNIFKKNLTIFFFQKPSIFYSSCVHTPSRPFVGVPAGRSLPLTVCTSKSFPIFIWFFFMFTFCHSESAPQNLSQFLFGSFSCSLSATQSLHLKIFPLFLFGSFSCSLFATHTLHLKIFPHFLFGSLSF